MAVHTGDVVRLFVPLYRSLRPSGSGETFHGIAVDSAPALGKARCLYLHETEGAFPSMWSSIHSWWCIDDGGPRRLDRLSTPYGIGYLSDEIFIEKPGVKFTHSDDTVLFNLSLGPGWFVKAQARFENDEILEAEVLYRNTR